MTSDMTYLEFELFLKIIFMSVDVFVSADQRGSGPAFWTTELLRCVWGSGWGG